MRNIVDKKGGVNSVYPPTEYLTFGPWIYMVPQYKPDDVLMLGYAGGTVAGLIRMIYGGLPITAVDTSVIDGYDEAYNVRLIKEDAREYVKRSNPVDAVIVDVYDDGDTVPCAFISEKEFAEDLKNIARYIIVHAHKDTDMSAYGKPLKVLSLNDSRFYYYMVYEINSLPIR